MEPVFPGMDPYLENPGIWPDFHEAFLFCIREALQPILPERYYAQLRTREEVGIGSYPSGLVFYPDVAVKKGSQIPQEEAESSVAGGSASTPEVLVIAPESPLTVSFLEIRETEPAGKLVALVELLSPSNKVSGKDREAFERKQSEVFASDAHWIEIDLLRAGKRLGGHPRIDSHCRAKGYDYVVVVSRSGSRSPSLKLEMYGFTVQDAFPTVAIPLVPPDADVPLDLGGVFRRAYETGPYRKVLRYDEPPPEPSLPGAVLDWARSRVASRGKARRT